MKIRRIDVSNFRGIKDMSWRLPTDQTFFVLIGPGDATKSTILTAVERGLSDRWNISFSDTDFHHCNINDPIVIRIAVGELPADLLALDELGLHLSGIDGDGNWFHDPEGDHEKAVIVELRVDGDLEPQWTVFRPDAEEGEEPHVLKARHRARFGAFRVDERVDTHLRWSRMSALGKLTDKKDATRKTLTMANRAARAAVAESMSPDLQALAADIAKAVRVIGSAEFDNLRPGLDMSLTNAQGNLALFDDEVPLTNYGLGTRRLAGTAAQQMAHDDATILLVDEVEYGLEPHRLVHLLRHLRNKESFAQVFVTTHSPTVLQNLDPGDLVVVRSADGETAVKSLAHPATLKPILKKNPEAFLSRRVVMGEGKTEYGLLLAFLERWNADLNTEGKLPSAALGVAGAEGGGGTTSCQWAEALLGVGYEVVLFLDSDEPGANGMVAGVEDAGGKVVQWAGEVCTERAICEHLDADGLTGLLAAAVAAHEDEEPEAALSSVVDAVQNRQAPKTEPPLDVTKWIDAGTDLGKARDIVGMAASKKVWFKNVDKGKHLAEFLLTRDELKTGPVAETVALLREYTYFRPGSPAEQDVQEETQAEQAANTTGGTAQEPA